MNPDEPRPREESGEEDSPLFFRNRRIVKIGGGIAFAVLALWMNSLTSVGSKSPVAHAAAQARPTFLDGFAIMMILTIVSVALAFASFRGRLGFFPGVIAFAALLGAALAVCYYR